MRSLGLCFIPTCLISNKLKMRTHSVGRPWKDTWRCQVQTEDWSDVSISWGLSVATGREEKEAANSSFSVLSKNTALPTLILSNFEMINCCCLSYWVCGTLIWQSWETETITFKYFNFHLWLKNYHWGEFSFI